MRCSSRPATASRTALPGPTRSSRYNHRELAAPLISSSPRPTLGWRWRRQVRREGPPCSSATNGASWRFTGLTRVCPERRPDEHFTPLPRSPLPARAKRLAMTGGATHVEEVSPQPQYLALGPLDLSDPCGRGSTVTRFRSSATRGRPLLPTKLDQLCLLRVQRHAALLARRALRLLRALGTPARRSAPCSRTRRSLLARGAPGRVKYFAPGQLEPRLVASSRAFFPRTAPTVDGRLPARDGATAPAATTGKRGRRPASRSRAPSTRPRRRTGRRPLLALGTVGRRQGSPPRSASPLPAQRRRVPFVSVEAHRLALAAVAHLPGP